MLATTAERGDESDLAYVHSWMTFLLARAGRLDEARHHLAEALRQAAFAGRVNRVWVLAHATLVKALSGDARRRRRVQDLLCNGLAVGQNESAAVEPDASNILQRADDSDGVRKSVAIQSSGYFEHGKLLALSLVTTLAAVLLFQPALMENRAMSGVGRYRRPDRADGRTVSDRMAWGPGGRSRWSSARRPSSVRGPGCAAVVFGAPLAMLLAGLEGIGGPTRVQVSPPQRKPNTQPCISS